MKFKLKLNLNDYEIISIFCSTEYICDEPIAQEIYLLHGDGGGGGRGGDGVVGLIMPGKYLFKRWGGKRFLSISGQARQMS